MRRIIRFALDGLFPKPSFYANDAMWRMAEDAREARDEAGAQHLMEMKWHCEDESVARWELRQIRRAQLVEIALMYLFAAVVVAGIIYQQFHHGHRGWGAGSNG